MLLLIGKRKGFRLFRRPDQEKERDLSYDLTVYSRDAQSLDPVVSLIESIRDLSMDSAMAVGDREGPGSVQVLRGVKRVYSFTIEGPFAVGPEDLPEEVSTVLPNASIMFQVLVEGTVESEIPHGVRFAHKLAKACKGVVMDEQTAEVWPQPKAPRASTVKVYPRVDAVEFAWYCLADELPHDLPQKYLALARELLPQAVPGRFGTHHPPQWDLKRDGDAAFSEAWQEPDSGVSLKTTYPVTWVSLSTQKSTRKTDVRNMRMTVATEALENDSFRAAVKKFFIRFSEECHAFHATAEVLRNYTLERKQLVSGPGAEEYRSLGLADGWVGLKPHPQWWMWFGPLYADTVRPYLTGHLEEHPQGIFHSWTEHPADRDELTGLLPDPAKPWIAEELTPVYEEGIVSPVRKATYIPQRLREARVERHRWTEE